MINQQTLEGHWNEIKGALKEHWGALTNDDLRRFNGDVDQLVGTIQRRTGETREAVQRFLEELTAEGSSIAANVVETARGLANRAAESAHDGYEHVVAQFRDRYAGAEELVRTRPAESIAVSFGAGLLAGLVLGLVLRAR
jgi:uncharacterized protein YjbJ (UPF0337 family)